MRSVCAAEKDPGVHSSMSGRGEALGLAFFLGGIERGGPGPGNGDEVWGGSSRQSRRPNQGRALRCWVSVPTMRATTLTRQATTLTMPGY